MTTQEGRAGGPASCHRPPEIRTVATIGLGR
jgi:hypothetical protein